METNGGKPHHCHSNDQKMCNKVLRFFLEKYNKKSIRVISTPVGLTIFNTGIIWSFIA